MAFEHHTAHPDAPLPPPRAKGVLAPFTLVLAGMVMLLTMALANVHQQERAPLAGAALIQADEAPWPGMRAVRLRVIPPSPDGLRGRAAAWLEQQPGGAGRVRDLHLDKGARVAFLENVPEAFGEVLAWGRMPVPGKPEALAGDLADSAVVSVPPVDFEVVGQLKRGVPVFLGAYILPAHPHFRALFVGDDVEIAWLDLAAVDQLQALALDAPDRLENIQGVESMSRAQSGFASLGILALVMMALGGSLMQFRLLCRAARRAPVFLGQILRDLAGRPRLAGFMHVILYAAFFGAMIAGAALPRLNLHMTEWTRYMFAEGDLDYIGAAYASGNIPAAAAATFRHNYLIATLLTSMLPSLIVPCWAVFANLLRFALVGFVLAPLWAESAAGYTYHGITMVLELEAYIVASFAAVMFVVHVTGGLWRGAAGEGLRRGLTAIGSGAVLVGIMLGVAALYEAATLILLGGM